MEQLAAVLNDLKTADMIYPQQMLADQIGYLYCMNSNAAQLAGKDAVDRYEELLGQFKALRDRVQIRLEFPRVHAKAPVTY